jgi:hypothetical protein
MTIRNLLPFIVFGTTAIATGVACGFSQYQVAADQFAKATAKGTSSVGTLSSSLVDRCWARADSDYTAARVLAHNLGEEQIRTLSGAQRYRVLASWEQWRDLPVRSGGVLTDPKTKAAIPHYATWSGYCGELQQSAKAFTVGIAALTTYATSLQTLAENGQGLGAQLTGLEAEVGSSLSGLSSNSSLASAAQAIQAPLQDLTNLFVSVYVEKKLKDYAGQADPKIQALIGALDGWLVAVQAWEGAVADNNKNLVRDLEGIMLGVRPQTFTQTADGGWNEPTLPPAGGLRTGHPEALAYFVWFARQQDQASEQFQATVVSSRTVLGSIKSAHTAFKNADGESGDALKDFMVQFSCLLKDLQGLQSIIAGKSSPADAGHAGVADGSGKCFKVSTGGDGG